MRTGKGLVRAGRQEHATHEPLISSEMVAEVPLAGLSVVGWQPCAPVDAWGYLCSLAELWPRETCSGRGVPLWLLQWT